VTKLPWLDPNTVIFDRTVATAILKGDVYLGGASIQRILKQLNDNFIQSRDIYRGLNLSNDLTRKMSYPVRSVHWELSQSEDPPLWTYENKRRVLAQQL
jgi:hypothetical protein